MHVHTVRTKYTYGDRVRYSSPRNGSGSGTISSMEFDQSGFVTYFIQVDGSLHVQGGIEDEEITPLPDEPEISTPFQV